MLEALEFLATNQGIAITITFVAVVASALYGFRSQFWPWFVAFTGKREENRHLEEVTRLELAREANTRFAELTRETNKQHAELIQQISSHLLIIGMQLATIAEINRLAIDYLRDNQSHQKDMIEACNKAREHQMIVSMQLAVISDLYKRVLVELDGLHDRDEGPA